MNLNIQLLGGMQIRMGEAHVTGFISNKVPAMLAYLVVNQRLHPRETLAALLWGEMPDSDARSNLRQVISNLHKYVGPYLTITRDSVQFNAGLPYTLDVEQFTRALQAGKLEEAIGFYQGDFLAGIAIREAPLFDEWVVLQQSRLRDQAFDILQRLMSTRAGLGEYGSAIDYANRILAFDPWREEIHRQLMLMLARSGQSSAALAQYNACRSMLRKEFDTDPSLETTALYERIKEAQKKPRGNLPAAVSEFIGRESELAQLHQMLASTEVRLITIFGSGGVGKTRLALETAATCNSFFLNGVWFVPLENEQRGDSGHFVLAIANALGYILSSSGEPYQELSHYLRQKELLLVLDGMEDQLHVAAWLAELLAQAPDLKILVTSRERLRLQGEHVYRLNGLPVPSGAQEQPELNAAWQLFLRRARLVQAGFSPSDADTQAIVKICRLIEGMPLGIELAASAVNQYTCGEIVDQIEGSVDFLQTSFRDSSPRQQNLSGVFEWSWNHLAPNEQMVFRRLSVFSGLFCREAAVHIAEATPAILGVLVDKSLAWRYGECYKLHQVARQFGSEKQKQAGDQETTCARHAEYYAHFLAVNGKVIQGAHQQEALQAIEKEFENIHAAWAWMVTHGEAELLAKAMDGLYHYTAVRSQFRLALELFGAARQALQHHTPITHQVRFTICRLIAREGRFLSFLSRFDEANQRLMDCLTPLTEMGEPDELAFVMGHLGGTARMQGNLEQAGNWLRQCLALRIQTGNQFGQAVALLELAGVAFMAADFNAARDACLQGLVIAEKTGEQQTIAHLLTGLSLCYRELGHYQQAQHYCQRSLSIYETLGDRYGVVQAYLTLGELHRKLGKFLEAQSFCQQAIDISQDIGHTSGEADGHYRLGQIALSMGEARLGLHHHYTGLKLASEIQEAPLILDSLCEIGELFQRLGLSAEAFVIFSWLKNNTEQDSPRTKKIASFFAEIPASQIPHQTSAGKALNQEDIICLVEHNVHFA